MTYNTRRVVRELLGSNPKSFIDLLSIQATHHNLRAYQEKQQATRLCFAQTADELEALRDSLLAGSVQLEDLERRLK